MTSRKILSLIICLAIFLASSFSIQINAIDVSKKKSDTYLKSTNTKWKLKKDLSDLNHVKTIFTKAGNYIRYQQVVDTLPVFTRQLTVTMNTQQQIIMVNSDIQPIFKITKIKKPISNQTAVAKALKYIKAKNKNTWAPTTIEHGYTVEKETALPTLRIVVHTQNPYGAWEVYLNADTGALQKAKNINRSVNGSGKVFLPNPIERQESIEGLKDNNDSNSTKLNKLRKKVTLKGLDGSGYLRGDYVYIRSDKNTRSTDLKFHYKRSDDKFEDVNVYYHIDNLQRHIQSLGFNNILNKQLKANVNTTSSDNSWYSPSTGELTFGSGGVDDGEDAGVIVHEYGHAIQDNQVPHFGNSHEGGSMGEGFGDFLGASYEDMTSNNPFGNACVAEWDAVSYSNGNPPCLRRLDRNKVYPKDIRGEVHEDGEIWSQALYDLGRELGRDIATRIILQSHWSLTPNATFNNGAKAILAADQLLYGGNNATIIRKVFSQRGISTN